MLLGKNYQLLEAKNVFERHHKSLRSHALGILLYHLGVSLRNCSLVLPSFDEVSHESVRQWYHRSQGFSSVHSCSRQVIAVDETMIKIQGKQHLLWATPGSSLGLWVTQGRASLDAYVFSVEYQRNV
jgi:putative transposase